MFYLKRWLKEDRQSPVLSLEIDTKQRMGEDVEDQEVPDGVAPSQDYPEEYFPPGVVNGAFIVTGHPGIGEFSYSW